MAALPPLPRTSVCVVFGTRPEAIKLAPLLALLGPAARTVCTGQHYDAGLWSSVLDDLGLPPVDALLDVGGRSRGHQIGAATAALSDCFAADRPRIVVVQGDTNAGLAGALAANAAGIPLLHVEAGLRSRDRAMPEEHNRVLIDHLADICAAPTEGNAANLAAEQITGERVEVTGNTVVESVHRLLPGPDERAASARALGLEPGGYILATVHRPENVDEPEALAELLDHLGRSPLPVALPIHPRTAARADAFGLGDALARLRVVDPLPPRVFLGLAAEAALLVSDSGGIQEEATVLKRHVVVVRRSTERPEALGSFSTLAERNRLDKAIAAGLAVDAAALAGLDSPFGDGLASERIAGLIATAVG